MFVVYRPSGRRVAGRKFRNHMTATRWIEERADIVQSYMNASNDIFLTLTESNGDAWLIKKEK